MTRARRTAGQLKSYKLETICEKCDEQILSRTMAQGDIARQVSGIYEVFNADAILRTCKNCSYVFSLTRMAERLGFLATK